MVVVARTNGDPSSLGPSITAAVRELDPGVPAYGVKPLEQVVAISTAPERFQTTLLAAFAAVALLLAITGVYAVMWYGVAQRRHEIGVRVALGARPRDIVRLVVGQGVGLALVGVAIGVAGALALGQVVASQLFGTSATNPPMLVAGAVVLLVVTALASFLPARKAAGTDPLLALRSE
jgi:putative ABC transport system permease protein